MRRNDIKCKNIFLFTLKNLARKGLSVRNTFSPTLWIDNIHNRACRMIHVYYTGATTFLNIDCIQTPRFTPYIAHCLPVWPCRVLSWPQCIVVCRHQRMGFLPETKLKQMKSWCGNGFRITGRLCGEYTGHRWIPLTKWPVMWNLGVRYDASVNKLLNEQLSSCWFETSWRSNHCHCN